MHGIVFRPTNQLGDNWVNQWKIGIGGFGKNTIYARDNEGTQFFMNVEQGAVRMRMANPDKRS